MSTVSTARAPRRILDHPLLGTEHVYKPYLTPIANVAEHDYSPGVLVVAPGLAVTVRAIFEDWNGVPGLTVLYVFVPATGLHTHVTPRDLALQVPC